jgi:xanthine dehydrogenase small subunit
MQSPSVTVNGQVAPLTGVPVHTTLLDWLRSRGLIGAKEGCAEGECGACSVLVARPAAGSGGDTPTRWTALNACLPPVLALDGQEVVTAEGLGTPDDLHPVQQEMAVRGGSQCGYCTPGFVCSMAAEFYRPDRVAAPANDPEADHLHGPNGFDLHALSGNLCRCTGYRPIRDAAFALGAPAEDALAARRDQPPPPVPGTRQADPLGEFVRPADLAQALGLLAERPGALLVAGSTDWGVDVNLRAARAALVIAVDRLPELRTFRVEPDAVLIGAALSLSEVEELLEGRVPLLDELFPQFASRLIRNGATLGGNLGTGSPIGDTAPALLALDASVVLASAQGEREVQLADYFTGYRQSVRRPGELIRAVRVPLPQPALVGFTKVAKRRFDDISSVAVAIALDVVDGVVRRGRIGLGGVAATPLRARATEDVLVGRPWTAGTVRAAAEVLATEGTPLDDHRASAAYRSAMLRQALLKFASAHRTPQEVGA